MCVPGRDVAEGCGLLLGEGGEGALERLDAEGVHVVVGVVAISKQVLGGREDNGRGSTEGAMEQRKAMQSYLASGHIWAPYCSARSKWLFARPRVLIAAIGADAERARGRKTMPDHVARLLTASWHFAQSLPASPHHSPSQQGSVIAQALYLPP